MKPIKLLGSVILLSALLCSKSYSQTVCAVNFSYYVAPNGNVTFTAFCSPSNSTSIYMWNFGNGTSTVTSNNFAVATYTSATNYTVTLTYSTSANGGCTGNPTYSAVVTPSVSCYMNVGSTAATGSLCNGSATVVNVWGLCGPASYTWIPGNFTGASISNVCPGNYTVIASGGTGTMCCPTLSQQVVIANNTNCTLQANFSTSDQGNGNTFFTNLTTGTLGVSNYTFFYGDGNADITQGSVSHQYTANGTYVATLSVVNWSMNCASHKTLTVMVSSYCGLIPSFSYSNTGNGGVQFFNNTTPTANIAYNWTFGNGSTSTQMNPSTTYTSSGIWPVQLYAYNTSSASSCYASSSHTIAVTSGTNCLNASFNYSLGSAGQATFVNTSTGSNTFTSLWTFPSGTTSVNSPVHTFTANGTYTVTLQIQSTNPVCSSSISQTVSITNITPCSLTASFTYTQGSNGSVSFNNTSTGTTSLSTYLWYFGNGSTFTTSSPSMIYLNGTYTVTLVVSNSPGCNSTSSQTIAVTSSTCIANATFSVAPTLTAQYWVAIPPVGQSIANAYWYWGDGQGSNVLFSSHQYSAAGTYDICLSVTLTCGAWASYCNPYYIYRTSGANDVINIEVIDPETVGLNELSDQVNNYVVCPNPNNGVFEIRGSGAINAFSVPELYNLIGEKVYRQSPEANSRGEKKIDASALPSGIYFLRMNEKVISKIIIDQRQ